MEFQKSEKAYLENKKTVFFLLGMVIILSVSYAAFNIKSFENFSYNFQMNVDEDLEELPPITTPPPPPLPPPPPAKPPVEPEIKLVEDEVQTEEPEIEDLDIENLEVVDEPIGEDPVEEIEDVPMVRVENMPFFPECKTASSNAEKEACTNRLIMEYTRKEFEDLVPEIAKDMQYSDLIYVQFTVSKQGKVTNVQILKGKYDILNKTAIQAVSKLPNFTPGTNMDRPVSILYTIPLKVSF